MIPLFFSSAVIHKRPGDDVVLPCWRDCGDVIEWSREDINNGDYVFFYRNDRAYEKYQLNAYKSRTYLKNPYTDQGDYSIIVKHLTVRDTTVYSCRVTCSHIMSYDRAVRTYVSLVVSPEVQYNSGDGREISPIALLTSLCIITVALL